MTSPLRPPEAGVVPSARPGGWLAGRWIDALRGADPARMARGRTWARGGRVRGFEVTPGLAMAEVLEGDSIGVSIRVDLWEAADWRRFGDVLRTRLTWIGALLEGALPADLIPALEAVGLRLLPLRREIGQSCDCDDWNSPCSHAAAVHAVLADALDGDPFLLLTLRGRGREQVLQDLHGAWGSAELSPEDIDDGAIPNGDWFRSPAPANLRFDFTSGGVTGAGLKSLGAPPGGADLIRSLAPLYDSGAAAALAIALEDVPDLPSHRDHLGLGEMPLPIREPVDDEQLTEELVDRLCDTPGARSQDLADALRLPMLRVRQELIALETLGIVYRTGNTRGTRWWVG